MATVMDHGPWTLGKAVFGNRFLERPLFESVLGNVFGNHVWLMHFWKTFLENHVWKKNILGNRFWESGSVPSTTNGTKRKQRNRIDLGPGTCESMKGHGTSAPGTRMPRCQDPGAKVHLVPLWFFWFRFGSSVTKKLDISIKKKENLCNSRLLKGPGWQPSLLANRQFLANHQFLPNRYFWPTVNLWPPVNGLEKPICGKNRLGTKMSMVSSWTR